MNTRTWADRMCPTCREIPKANGEGILSCACGDKVWEWVRGVAGTQDESAMLERNGFKLVRDIKGDVYYVGIDNRIVWLFPDGTWRASDTSQEGRSLEAYLKTVSEAQAEF